MKEVTKIFHLSDIHIRLFDRHTEYREVFEKTYELIKNSGIYDSEEVLREIFKATKRYPENILLFSSFAKKSNLNAIELMEKINLSGVAFEKFMAERVYLLISD